MHSGEVGFGVCSPSRGGWGRTRQSKGEKLVAEWQVVWADRARGGSWHAGQKDCDGLSPCCPGEAQVAWWGPASRAFSGQSRNLPVSPYPGPSSSGWGVSGWARPAAVVSRVSLLLNLQPPKQQVTWRQQPLPTEPVAVVEGLALRCPLRPGHGTAVSLGDREAFCCDSPVHFKA